MEEDSAVDIALSEMIVHAEGEATFTLAGQVGADGQSDAVHGQATLEDGVLHYVPNADFYGEDFISVQMQDASGRTSAVKQVHVLVNNVNDAPVLHSDEVIFVERDDAALFGNPFVLDIEDADGHDRHEVMAVSELAQGYILNRLGESYYVPPKDWNGSFDATLKVSDGQAESVERIVTFVVEGENDAPEVLVSAVSVKEDQETTVNIAVKDADSDEDALHYVIETQPQYGTLYEDENGELIYTPDADFSGTDAFWVHASDGQLSSESKEVSITVKPMPEVIKNCDFSIQTEIEYQPYVNSAGETTDIYYSANELVAVTEQPLDTATRNYVESLPFVEGIGCSTEILPWTEDELAQGYEDHPMSMYSIILRREGTYAELEWLSERMKQELPFELLSPNAFSPQEVLSSMESTLYERFSASGNRQPDINTYLKTDVSGGSYYYRNLTDAWNIQKSEVAVVDSGLCLQEENCGGLLGNGGVCRPGLREPFCNDPQIKYNLVRRNGVDKLVASLADQDGVFKDTPNVFDNDKIRQRLASGYLLSAEWPYLSDNQRQAYKNSRMDSLVTIHGTQVAAILAANSATNESLMFQTSSQVSAGSQGWYRPARYKSAKYFPPLGVLKNAHADFSVTPYLNYSLAGNGHVVQQGWRDKANFPLLIDLYYQMIETTCVEESVSNHSYGRPAVGDQGLDLRPEAARAKMTRMLLRSSLCSGHVFVSAGGNDGEHDQEAVKRHAGETNGFVDLEEGFDNVLVASSSVGQHSNHGDWIDVFAGSIDGSSSLAAPLVTGTAALIHSLNSPEPADIKRIIIDGSLHAVEGPGSSARYPALYMPSVLLVAMDELLPDAVHSALTASGVQTEKKCNSYAVSSEDGGADITCTDVITPDEGASKEETAVWTFDDDTGRAEVVINNEYRKQGAGAHWLEDNLQLDYSYDLDVIDRDLGEQKVSSIPVVRFTPEGTGMYTFMGQSIQAGRGPC